MITKLFFKYQMPHPIIIFMTASGLMLIIFEIVVILNVLNRKKNE